jgi:hypothetical protein
MSNLENLVATSVAWQHAGNILIKINLPRPGVEIPQVVVGT